MRILIAEDERDLCSVLVKRLSAHGYGVDSCDNGEDALEYLAAAEYDAVVMDIMMPQKSGLEVLDTLRKQGDLTPVLLLTARDAIEDRVAGLDVGANDYLVKPFSLDELLARIRAMTRKTASSPTNTYMVVNLVVDCAARTVCRDGALIALSSREFSILEYMVRNQGIVLSREKIEMNVWNYEYEGSSNVVDVYIRNLRRKIDDSYAPKLIHTIRGSGYVLREEL